MIRNRPSQPSLKLPELWEDEPDYISKARTEELNNNNNNNQRRESSNGSSSPSEYSTPLDSPTYTSSCSGTAAPKEAASSKELASAAAAATFSSAASSSVFWFPSPPEAPPLDTPASLIASPLHVLGSLDHISFRTRTGSLVDDLLSEIYLKLNKYNWSRLRERADSTSSSIASTPEPFANNARQPVRQVQLRTKSKFLTTFCCLFSTDNIETLFFSPFPRLCNLQQTKS